MHYPPQGDSIWGNINTAVEIALNVYYVFAENGEGIMIPKDKARDTISEKAAAAGMENNGYLCYDKDENMDIPMYEVLQRRVAACERIKAQALMQMQEIKRDGSLRLADYFSECEPPVKTPGGAAEKSQKVRNGIYFVSAGDAAYFAVHENVAESFMSPIANEFGTKENGYLYYDLTTCAIPLHELRHIYGEVDNLIVSEDSLYATLGTHFKSYVDIYNDIIHEEERIPPVKAPAVLFLQRHLDAKQAETTLEQSATHEAYYSEQSDDYGFQP